MRNTFWLSLVLGCGPRGVATDSTLDGGGDADTDADADADADSDADTDTGLTGVDCSAGPPETGVWSAHPIVADGASAQSTPYTNDAGVGALRTATIGADHAVVDLAVSGAIVTAIGYFPASATTANFWFEDAGGPMYAFDVDLGTVLPSELKVGDEIAFTATEVNDYFDTLEVTAMTGFSVLSSGNPVHVVDGMTGPPLTFAEHGMYVVEIWGGPLGTPTDCSSNCYELDYGANTVTFRSGSSFLYPGDCVHWIGPVGAYSGEVQLDSVDYDWVWAY